MIKSVFCGVLITLMVKIGFCDHINEREKRFLLFPEASPTRHQVSSILWSKKNFETFYFYFCGYFNNLE